MQGKIYLQFNYKMGDNELRKSSKEGDFGVIVECSEQVTEQCVTAAKNAKISLEMIKRNIDNQSKDVIVTLYKVLVRPKLEYFVQAWCPYFRKGIDVLERVQKRATKMIAGFRHLNYENRLIRTGLLPLENVELELRGDLIQVISFQLKLYQKSDDIFKLWQLSTHRYISPVNGMKYFDE
jgi:ribonucleases P/MRP protein subunit RPP40